jgi:hypothetical protein
MNGEALVRLERPYGEVVDDLLTAVVGGVVNEPLLFDVKSARYPLAEPALAIRSVTGVIADAHTQFQLEVDFTFSAGDNALIWRDEGRRPQDDSIFHVDYIRRFSDSPLTDINVGSVTRTLTEAVAREVAFVYQQIKAVYLSAFIDTATGQSLDFVVAILGVTRKRKDFAEGLETFFRDPSSPDGNVSIPEGTTLSTAKGEATFITSQLRTLQRGQSRIDVPIRATEASRGPTGVVAAGLINTLGVPITGVARVTNFDPTILGDKDETDEELRARAKATVRSLGKATLAALKRVVQEERAELLDVFEPNIPGKETDLGMVVLSVNIHPGRLPSLNAALHDTRAAGVGTFILARYVFVKPRIVIALTEGLTAAGKEKVLNQVASAIGTYLESLAPSQPAIGTAILDAIKLIAEVTAARIADVIVRRTDLANPSAAGLEAARFLLLNEAGGPISDADFGVAPDFVPAFQIITSPDEPDKWFLVLDMDPKADIVIEGRA